MSLLASAKNLTSQCISNLIIHRCLFDLVRCDRYHDRAVTHLAAISTEIFLLGRNTAYDSCHKFLRIREYLCILQTLVCGAKVKDGGRDSAVSKVIKKNKVDENKGRRGERGRRVKKDRD